MDAALAAYRTTRQHRTYRNQEYCMFILSTYLAK